jgi:ferredoxin
MFSRVATKVFSGAVRVSTLKSFTPCARWFCKAAEAVETVPITFVEGEGGEEIEVLAPVGKNVLDVALDFDIDIEGACGGELACSTCHVILSQELYDSLPEKEEEEEDMLDLAFGLTDTSRLCCQIKVTPELKGAVFTVPDETNNML